MRKTKIVCTIGPGSEKVELLCQLIEKGMNVARLNFSHGDHQEHYQRIKNIREASRIMGRPVAIMLDTQGPEIRTGFLKEDRIYLTEGQKVSLTPEDILGDQERIHINYPELIQDVQIEDVILIDDGLIALKVLEIRKHELLCVVLNGGELTNRKGVNIPGVNVNLPAVTDKDIRDIKFGVDHGVDFIAASFVRNAQDALEIRRILEGMNADIHIIAKIENQQGVHNADEIIMVTNGLMVARGDLGVEIPAEDVPLVQKSLIEKCNCVGKPVIIATQMLDSMIRNPRPTRAEASDVANAILDGTDAIMLSGETSVGQYPVQAVATMDIIARKAETAIKYEKILRSQKFIRTTTPDAISHATCAIAEDLEAEAIITATESGSTSKMVAKHRPKPQVIAVTPSRVVQRRLLLVWGVEPLYAPGVEGTDAMVEQATNVALEAGLIKNGDLVVLTTGVPVGIPGTTNLIKVETVGQYLAKGTGLGRDCITGVVKIVRNGQEAEEQINEGDILVAAFTDADFVPAIKRAGAIVTERAGLTSHAAIVGLNLGVPTVVGVKDVTKILKSGMEVSVDIHRGLIYRGRANII